MVFWLFMATQELISDPTRYCFRGDEPSARRMTSDEIEKIMTEGSLVLVVTRVVGFRGITGFYEGEVELMFDIEGLDGCLQVPVGIESEERRKLGALKKDDEILIIAAIDLVISSEGQRVRYLPRAVLAGGDRNLLWGTSYPEGAVARAIDCRNNGSKE